MNELKYFRRNRVVEEYPISSHVLQIKVDDIRPNRAQPRADFDNNSIIRLADSIRRYGIIQPLTVRKSDEDDIYAYELVAGERRLRAARMLGYFTVPCIVIEADERMSAEMAIIENLLRKDLNMFEQAYGFKRLIENHGLTQDEVARRMSMSQSAVANKIRLLRLSDTEQRLILESELSERHARALLRIESERDRIEAIRHIVSFSLNVVNTEQYIDLLLKRAKTPENNEKASISGELEREKAAKNLVEQIKRKISGMNKQGHEATVRVGGDAENIEVVIRIART
ncbi:MAG: ParB/RepB/Spo0J family partition protein [Ruminococcaceae bacterium]|nr:ParB/RepB/Spo0J family partition protein [Oscillospiraceae bacterium]